MTSLDINANLGLGGASLGLGGANQGGLGGAILGGLGGAKLGGLGEEESYMLARLGGEEPLARSRSGAVMKYGENCLGLLLSMFWNRLKPLRSPFYN